MAQHISWSQGCSTSPLISKSILRTSTLVWTTSDSIIKLQVCCRFWAVLSAKSSVTVLSVIHFTSHFKVQMASSHCNSSTPVPLLGTPFNMILCFSEPMAYLPNAPWCSRRLHQWGCSSLRSPSSTIQPGWTVLPVPGPSIVTVNNDPNWENASTTNPNTNLTANKPTSSTHSQSKPHWCYGMLWTLNNFYFILFYFSILLLFYFCFFFFLKNNKEACDNEVTWHVTWCDVTSLEHDERVWKMMSRHMEYIWWPWVEHKINMRQTWGQSMDYRAG